MKLLALSSVVLFACSGSGGNAPDGGVIDAAPNDATTLVDSAPTVDAMTDAPNDGYLSSKYPGDIGIDKDPAVVWYEGFEQGSLSTFAARYDQVDNQAGMQLTSDVPAKSGGKSSISLTTSGDGANATDFYKSFPSGYDEWFVRWYVKYQIGAVTWHHSGVWFGGYDPPIPYPDPQAGNKPNGDDRISYAIEPIWGNPGAMQFDTYDYWMNMHSWMDVPTGTDSYYGNAILNETSLTVDEGSWVCVEMHVKLNTSTSSNTGAVLEVWKNDVSFGSYTDSTPNGYWIKDKFCTQAADGTQCTDYPAPFNTVLDLQARTTDNLKLTYFWPQNYITTSGVTGTMQLDEMVIATTRIGCMQ